MVGALTRGNAALEDAVAGWHSGNLFADSMGEDAIELSGGRQSFVLGDAFLIGRRGKRLWLALSFWC